MADKQTVQAPRLLNERYELKELLGAGGMGEVFLGRQVGLDRPVAIKIIHHALDPGGRVLARFRQEAQVIKELTHPNTVRIYDFGETDDGNLFIVLEYLRGKSFDLVLKERGSLHLTLIARTAQQVLKSLIEAHSRGIVHRDIKPNNLMLCEQPGETDLVKVLDFGVAHLAEASLLKTQKGVMVGTPHYMSPEQARGFKIDRRSDLYSLGITLFELATGELPYRNASPVQIAMRHIAPEPVPIPHWLLGTPLGPLLTKALAKDRDARYGSAEKMLDALMQANLLEYQISSEVATTLEGPPATLPEEMLAPTTSEITEAESATPTGPGATPPPSTVDPISASDSTVDATTEAEDLDVLTAAKVRGRYPKELPTAPNVTEPIEEETPVARKSPYLVLGALLLLGGIAAAGVFLFGDRRKTDEGLQADGAVAIVDPVEDPPPVPSEPPQPVADRRITGTVMSVLQSATTMCVSLAAQERGEVVPEPEERTRPRTSDRDRPAQRSAVLELEQLSIARPSDDRQPTEPPEQPVEEPPRVTTVDDTAEPEIEPIDSEGGSRDEDDEDDAPTAAPIFFK